MNQFTREKPRNQVVKSPAPYGGNRPVEFALAGLAAREQARQSRGAA